MSARQVVAGPRIERGPALVAAVSVCLALGGLALSLSRPRVANLVTGHDVGDAAMAVACALVGGLILGRRPRHPVGTVFTAIGLADGISLIGSGLGEVLRPGDPGFALAIWLAGWVWLPGLLLPVTVLPLVFPEGVAGTWGRRLLAGEIGVITLACLAAALSPRLRTGPSTEIGNPVGVTGADTVAYVALGAALACAVASVTVLIVRLVRADDRLRRQLLPLLAAGIVVIPVFVVADRLGTAGAVLQDACILLIPAAALLSVLRLRLYDLEVAIGRSLVWLLLSAALIGGYVVVVQLTATWLHLHGRIASVLATAVIAVAFGPARTTLQGWVARWLYGNRGDPYGALAHTTQILSGSADPAGGLHQATADLAHRLRSPGVRVLQAGRLLAGPAEGRPALAVPLWAGEVEVGRLEVLPRAPGESFSRTDQRLILDLCPPLATAVAAIALAEELRSSRERLALAREAERRRVRSELHDDVGPALAAVAVQARTAQRRLERHDDGGAAEVLAALSGTIRRAAGDLRGAIDALGPGVLDELGLPEAVRSFASAAERPIVLVEVGELGPLPAAVEVAVYRVIAEGVTNARRHAAAGRIRVRLERDRECVELAVEDDGIGIAATVAGPGPVGGVGIPSMRARVEELGGSLSVRPAEDGPGTWLRASVPVGAPSVRAGR